MGHCLSKFNKRSDCENSNSSLSENRVLKKTTAIEDVSHKAFGNSQIAEKISGFASMKDLVRLRLVNRLFHQLATKRLSNLNCQILLKDQDYAEKFLSCMKEGQELGLGPFPFSSFSLHLENFEPEFLENFGTTVGQHVRYYHFKSGSGYTYHPCLFGPKVAILLSYSPQIRKIEIYSKADLRVQAQDILRIPKKFPQLIAIRGNHSYNRKHHEDYGKPQLLAHILIGRAPKLKKFIVSIPDKMETFQLLSQHHGRSVQVDCYDFPGIVLFPNTVDAFLSEFSTLNLNFRKLRIFVREKYMPHMNTTAAEVQHMYQTVESWLGTLKNSLIKLCIRFDVNPEMGTFTLPSLPALTHLSVSYLGLNELSDDNQERQNQNAGPGPVVPLIQNQFPVLKKVYLAGYREYFGVFDQCTLPTVQSLRLGFLKYPFTNPQWTVVFPNLTSVYFYCPSCSDVITASSIAFILSHLPRLSKLSLDVINWADGGREPDLWDILTGRAPRPDDTTTDLLNGELVQAVYAEDPVDGVYQVPSLANMKSLKKFEWNLECQSSRLLESEHSVVDTRRPNLDAVLYMSRLGLLGPLEKLIVYVSKFDLEDVAQAAKFSAYQAKLAQIHHNVEF